ncbi:ribosome maturation factor [Weissella muntiaci]|uniref:Ribosome maturation factor RimP n=1 Tax=Weissella muntiaci TaxID=2508881 RepID=A0A6C2CB23_9LACO|nr:ribosome maturation factor RimP [Weissella muntiaci]TYC50792.1 ribosome maturation factor [Weissella muntiaci]
MANVVETVKDILTTDLATRGFVLWDVLYEKQDTDMVLRVLVDRQTGAITMDDLVMLTELIGEQLDAIQPDPFPEAYLMDVSSPGAERTLKRPEDFAWALEKTIRLELTEALDGVTSFEGELVKSDEQGLTLAVSAKGKRKLIEVSLVQVQTAQLAISQSRVLTTPEDFAWATNKMIHVSTYQKIDGVKDFTGELTDVDETSLELTTDDEQVIKIPRTVIAQARQANDF